MDCLEFRRSAGADPRHPGAAAITHAESCVRCAAYLRELLALDARILAAMQVPVPAAGPARPAGRVGTHLVLARGRWLAFAASVIGGVLVGSLLWVGSPRPSLADDLVAHMAHEPGVMIETQATADPAELAAVLALGGIRLRPGADRVSYANTCWFRGDRVPHLVVQTDAGPVTVIVLRNEKVTSPVGFAEQGYVGTILPAGPGSIAVLGPTGADLAQVAGRVAAAVEWS
jgi:hypothetical protein